MRSQKSEWMLTARAGLFAGFFAAALAAEKPGPLPRTTLWDFPDTIVTEQYRELRDFYERQIRDSAPRREAFSRKAPEDQRKLLRDRLRADACRLTC